MHPIFLVVPKERKMLKLNEFKKKNTIFNEFFFVFVFFAYDNFFRSPEKTTLKKNNFLINKIIFLNIMKDFF